MWPYAIRRVLGAVPTLLVIIALTFFMMHIAPGGPFDAQRHLPPEIEHNVRAAYNLDKPVWEQFWIYLERLAHGDLGPSYKNHDFTVTQLIEVGLPVSARLGFSAIILAIVLGITLGTVAALNQNKATDYGVMGLAMIGITIPTFVTAPVLALVFGIYGLHFFGYDFFLPAGGWNGGALANMVLPVTVLALPQIAVISRLVRGSMVEVLRSNYVRTARAKGLPEWRVVLKHVLRNALIPVVTVIGLQLGLLLSGAVLTETIFSLPGLGRLMVNAILARDYPVVQAAALLTAFLFVVVNLLVDLSYAYLDPRIRYR